VNAIKQALPARPALLRRLGAATPPALRRLPAAVLSRAPLQLDLDLRVHIAAKGPRALIVAIALGADSDHSDECQPQAQRRPLPACPSLRRRACQGTLRRR
jgi:hypothetical protein